MTLLDINPSDSGGKMVLKAFGSLIAVTLCLAFAGVYVLTDCGYRVGKKVVRTWQDWTREHELL